MKKKKPMKHTQQKRQMKKATDQDDITELMFRDHKPLKRLIKIMKNVDTDFYELKSAFREFAPLLEAHAFPEQESLYTQMIDGNEKEIRIEGFEGKIEHALADQLATQILDISDEDEWKAQVKILAELVEHHIEEEEEEMIPSIRKEMDLEQRIQIGEDYLRRRSKYHVESEAA